MRAELKARYGLTAQQIHSNLTYLESQGWVKDDPITKSVMTRAGGVIPSTTSYFVITAAGIDRIGGPSMFTRDRFKGIRIEATGQNIITLGDGNQVNAKFQDIGESLVELRRAIKESDSIDEMQKMELVVDVDTLQTQLAKPTPNRELISRMWEGINRAASIAGLAEAAHQSVNSRAEHFTSFCENSDPMLARTAAGCLPSVTQDRHSDRASDWPDEQQPALYARRQGAAETRGVSGGVASAAWTRFGAKADSSGLKSPSE